MSYIVSFSTFLLSLKRKQAYLASCILGMLVTAALPPVYILPLAVVGFTGHFWMLDACQERRRSFWLGWWFGFGYFVTGLYWISFALLVDVAQFGWLIPFALFGIAAVVAFYPALVGLAIHGVRPSGPKKVLLFAVVWTSVEIARSYLFTGFPWNLIGYVWTVSDAMLQLASVTGIWGLSLLTVFTFTLPATLIYLNDQRLPVRDSLIPTVLGAVLLCVVWAGGYYRLSQAPTDRVGGIMLRIVQPNIAQDLKWDPDRRRAIVQQYMSMTLQPGFEQITHVIWPETALPFYIDDQSPLLDVIKHAVPPHGALITGSLHAERSASGFPENLWNALHVIDDQGHLQAVYHKHHLVPFGEYVPFREYLPLNKITDGTVDFSTGDGPHTLNIPNFPPFSPLICYEVIFPGKVVDKTDYPKLLINVTNDAWYGNTSGPYQHFQMARVRAVEQGVPLIRAANSGISGVIDGYGRVVGQTSLGKTTTLDIHLPSDIGKVTLFSRFDALIKLFIVVFCGFFFIFWL